MKIRNQITVLVAFIIAIPVLCALYFPVYHYFTSPNRFLLDGYQAIPKSTGPDLSKNDLIKIGNELRFMPHNVQTAILSDHFEILDSSIPELKNVDFLSYNTFLSFIENTSADYFYQFSTLKTEESRVIILTRVPRQTEKTPPARNRSAQYLIYLLFVLVFICIIIIIFISRTIFKSISLIEKQTQGIADGNLDIKIETNQKNQNEITRITDSLERMRLSLVDAQTRRNKFIMGISHDLRTPVAIIKGYTEAINDGVVKEEEMGNTLNLISAKTSQLETMINTLINFMKLDTNDWRQNLKEENITKLIENFGHDACITGPLFNRNVTADIQFDNEVFVPLDSQLVTRVFENLLSNAIRYTKDNDSIFVWARETEDSVVLKIKDTGDGMSEEDLNHIFDLFYRGTNSRREEGMGIGLSVVKSIITTLNWQISVESKLNEGSVFIITIPKNN